VNLADVLVFSLGVFPAFGVTLAVIGAGLGARTAEPPQDRPQWTAAVAVPPPR
jgi:hypothetical protein